MHNNIKNNCQIMFSTNTKSNEIDEETLKKKEKRTTFSMKQQNYLISSSDKVKENGENVLNDAKDIDELLEREKQYNTTESWNKLDKTIKIKKLNDYAEKYGKENNCSTKEIKNLKSFLKENLEKNKLNRTKDVNYNKISQEISNIPSLFFNNTTKNFTLKNTDVKRVSTIKSLTPKKNKDKATAIEIMDDENLVNETEIEPLDV